MPPLYYIVGKRQIGLAEDKIGTDEIVRCTHGQNTYIGKSAAARARARARAMAGRGKSRTGNHEPTRHPRHAPRDLRRREDGDPRILATSDGVHRTDLGHRVRDRQTEDADADPGIDHDGRPAGLDSKNQDSPQCRPAGDDAEAEADHAQEAEGALQLLLIA